MSMASNDIVKVGSVTLESAIANTQDWFNFIKNLPFVQTSKMYIFKIKGNNSTNQYKGICSSLYSTDFGNTSNTYNIYVRSANATSTTSTSWLFEITAGSVVDVYEVVI